MPDRAQGLISAVHLATKKLSTTTSVEETLHEVLVLSVEATGADGGTIYIHDAGGRKLRFRHVLPEAVREKLPMQDIPDNFGIAGKVFQEQQAFIGTVCGTSAARSVIEEATNVAVNTMLTAPLMVDGSEPIGVVQLINKRGGDFDQHDLEVMETVGAVSAMAYINSILTEQASRAASLMGMGKVSHDIGNLAASLHSNMYFMEPLLKAMTEYQEADVAIQENAVKMSEAVADLRGSVDRIVGYSRLISDLSAGRPLRPSTQAGRFPSVVRDAAAYLEPEARKNGVELRYEIEDGDEDSMFDAQFVFRIVQNLVGNAIKAVAETGAGGFVAVRCLRRGGCHVIEVADSGPGMPQETIERILAGKARSQWSSGEGSGWGTKIVLELVAALGGSMEIESASGEGTTMSVRLPLEVAADEAPASV